MLLIHLTYYLQQRVRMRSAPTLRQCHHLRLQNCSNLMLLRNYTPTNPHWGGLSFLAASHVYWAYIVRSDCIFTLTIGEWLNPACYHAGYRSRYGFMIFVNNASISAVFIVYAILYKGIRWFLQYSSFILSCFCRILRALSPPNQSMLL